VDAQIANEFLRACNASFGFLVSQYGFGDAVLDIDTKIGFATVSFTAKNVAVECIFDEREAWVEVKIARVCNGQRPATYSIDVTGRKVRESLYPLLLRKGVRDFGPRPVKQTGTLQEMFQRRLSKDANLLRKHGAEVLSDSATVLDE